MRKRNFMLLLSFFLLITGCAKPAPTSSGSNSESPPTTLSEAGPESSEASSENISVPKPETGTQLINFYAINDFHGALIPQAAFQEPGIAKVATFLKEKRQTESDQTVIISSGDMWQGSFEAYFNKGEIVTEIMNDIGFDAMAIGNHEFDWGPEYILNNVALANFPLLGANIMKYPETTEKSEIGEEYVIVQKGPLKVGIIGAIGQKQIESITSSAVSDIYFETVPEIVKNISTKLRNEEEVDLVVLSLHDEQKNVSDELTRDGYLDAVFNAHSHAKEKQVKFGVPYIQGHEKGKCISHIQLSYDFAKKKPTTKIHKNLTVDELQLTEDAEVKTILDEHKVKSDVVANRPVGHASGEFSKQYLARFANYATSLKAIEKGYDIDFVMSNDTREPLKAGNINYSDLFKGIPFDNGIYIAKALGADIVHEYNYDSTHLYRVKDNPTFETNKYYTLAVIDYMLLHQRIDKTYNYFSNYSPERDFIAVLKNEDGSNIYHRDLLEELILKEPNKTISPLDARFTNNQHGSLRAY